MEKQTPLDFYIRWRDLCDVYLYEVSETHLRGNSMVRVWKDPWDAWNVSGCYADGTPNGIDISNDRWAPRSDEMAAKLFVERIQVSDATCLVKFVGNKTADALCTDCLHRMLNDGKVVSVLTHVEEVICCSSCCMCNDCSSQKDPLSEFNLRDCKVYLDFVPTDADIGAMLEIMQEAQSYIDPCCDNEDCECQRNDIRLQVHNGSATLWFPLRRWSMHTGDAQYDQDHRGFWGASCVSQETTEAEMLAILVDMFEQAIDHAAECAS